MPTVKGYAAYESAGELKPFSFERREPGAKDITLEILYCGVCHSDLHQVKNEWGGSTFPMVPGHEIVGRVIKIGKKVRKFKVGSIAGIGCFVDSCRTCVNCKKGEEQFCQKRASFTYNGVERDGKTKTQGGYSSGITIDEHYALKISAKAPLEKIAPLLCAGITTYSPLKRWGAKKGQRVGVMGLGGLGHMAVKLAKSMGAEVTVLSTSKNKEADAKKLGAQKFALTSDPATMAALANKFHLILNTVSAPIDLNAYLALLETGGTMVMLGVPPKPAEINAFNLIGQRRQIGGSMIGGIRETQEMLDYCAKKKIYADVEVIPMAKINEAYERLLKGDVHYRFVIDSKTI